MIHLCIADNDPVVHFGLTSYFKHHNKIKIVSNLENFEQVETTLKSKNINVLLIDLDLKGLKSISSLKPILKDFPETKIIVFSNYPENIYAPSVVKAGCAGYIHKNSNLNKFGAIIIKANKGEIVLSKEVRNNIQLLTQQKKSERLYRKLSNREVEVLRLLSMGKKNIEIAETLSLNEKTISTYKLRLLMKLEVTNLIDLINKAATLEIV